MEKIKQYLWSGGDIKLYFVVPSDKFDEYPWQSYHTVNNLVSFSHSQWIDKIPQYVLDINLHGSTLMSNTTNESNESDEMVCEE